ncbi:hypothetical protein LLG96_02725 [bacterium]|nr:hypothetical protein [bacterium]
MVCKLLVILVWMAPAPVIAQDEQDEYQQVIGLLHMDSEVSGGENSLDMLAAVAKNAGAQMAIVTDHDTQRATYGIWPLKKILKMSHSRPSVRTYGIDKYLKEVQRVNRQNPDFTYIPGIEAVPYYWWKRSVKGGDLIIRDIHQHILVFGLEKPEQLQKLPSIEAGYPMIPTPRSLMQLLWLIPLIIALIIFRIPDTDEYYESSLLVRFLSRPLNFLAILIGTVSIVFLINGFPFMEPVVDQYDEDAGALPYQILINYVRKQGGLTFWAHPEAQYYQTIISGKSNPLVNALLRTALTGELKVETDPYYHLLNETTNYTGFSIFFNGMNIVGKPEGLWDDLLLQFVSGHRNRPLWAIAEIDMEEGTDPLTASESQTVFLVKEKTKREYLEALRTGRVYCFCSHINDWLTIRDYSVIAGDTRAISGEVLPYAEDTRLIFDVDLHGKPLDLEAVIVKDGKILERRPFSASERMEIPLSGPREAMGYVRITVYQGGNMVAATNPIFFSKVVKP